VGKRLKEADILILHKIYGEVKLNRFYFLLKMKNGISYACTSKQMHPNSEGKYLFKLLKKRNFNKVTE